MVFRTIFKYCSVLFPSQLFTSVQKVIGHCSGSEPWVSKSQLRAKYSIGAKSSVVLVTVVDLQAGKSMHCQCKAASHANQAQVSTRWATLRSHNVNMLLAEFWISANNFDIFNNQHTTTHSEPIPVPIDISYMSEIQNELFWLLRRRSLNSHLRRDIEGFAHIRVPLCMCMCVTRGAWAQIVWTAFPILKSSLMHCAHDLPIQVHVLFLIPIVFSPPLTALTVLMIMILRTAFPILRASWCVTTILPFKFRRVFARDAHLGLSKSRVQNMTEI